MTEIKNLKVYGLNESMIRSGFPMRTKEPVGREVTGNDLLRMSNLSKVESGTGHDNALKGIIVQFDLKYPQYLSMQLQRYHFIDIISSQSKMRCLTKGNFECNKYVDDVVANRLDIAIGEYNKVPTYGNFMRCISNCPMGLELWMGISTNYLQLKTIYHQRKNHKLKEDWGTFCDMIQNLPHSELITYTKKGVNE